MSPRLGTYLVMFCLSFFVPVFTFTASAQSSGILVVDLERAYETSKFGQSMRDAFNLKNKSFNQENMKILNSLKNEEIQLTEDRANLSPNAFATAAEAFDVKVQKIRKNRLEKMRVVEDNFKLLKQIFLREVDPLFDMFMRKFKASAILESNSVVRSVQAIDITDLLIERVDQAFTAREATQEVVPKK